MEKHKKQKPKFNEFCRTESGKLSEDDLLFQIAQMTKNQSQ
jgi:hypothetical protein